VPKNTMSITSREIVDYSGKMRKWIKELSESFATSNKKTTKKKGKRRINAILAYINDPSLSFRMQSRLNIRQLMQILILFVCVTCEFDTMLWFQYNFVVDNVNPTVWSRLVLPMPRV